ncbi:DNA damage-induced apoptosis suppressor protein isoform X2 [Plectropomus leopardus]|uniref:DNA damage-induced apoptosis suppressor protein isoform X2 n=1 Tax=Plectropomus leopardus TaxID=160734 RepID=UPI001C4AFA50|nr:DNA damage-induced apoptosis suppressor protein isoform X2 [Plectropomus leopardus]
MSVRRALVGCVVLSLKDTCVFYPCCKSCFSRIDVEQQDVTRCRCSKCGYSCLREQVDYRYRLSLKVTRDRSIFGVTVFGTCLNPFFGIHASGLQRLVENSDGASTRSTLLVKAVQDCFIGRHFIFGIKVAETESWPWFRGPVADGFSSKEAVHFIASQMLLPKATGLQGCTVVSYYRILLQKAAEYEKESADPSKRPPATTLLLIPCHFPASSFNNATLSASGLLSQSLQSSQHQDGTLTPTPPWQQSLGLVTSSAEQEEDCSTQDSGDERSSQTSHHAQRDCLEILKVTEERAPSPLLSLECSSSLSPSLAKCSYSSAEKAVGNTPILNTWFSPPPPAYNSSKGFSTKTLLSDSLAWEDLPFSESLTEFLCEENKDFDKQTEQHAENQKETSRNNLEISSQHKNDSHKFQITGCHSQILLDIANTPAPNGGDRNDLSDQEYKSPLGSANTTQSRNISSSEGNQEDEKACSLSFENEEEQLEEDTYNCSADLFGSSFIINVSTNKLSTHAETVRLTTEARPPLSKPKTTHQRSDNATHSTPQRQTLKSQNCINRDTQELDFIPPSQSTPIVKVGAVTGPSRTLTLSEVSSQPDSQDSGVFYRRLPEWDRKETATATSALCKLSCVSDEQLSQRSREPTKENLAWSSTSSRHRFTPKRRFWKPDTHKNHLRRVLQSARRIKHKCDSSNCDMSVYDHEDNEVIVPPTPAAERRQCVKLRGKRPTDNSSSNLGISTCSCLNFSSTATLSLDLHVKT